MVALLDTSCSLLADKGQPNQGDTNRMGRPKARCGDAPSPYRTFSPCTEPPQPWSHPAQCQHALGRNQKGTPPAPRGPQPCPLLTIACASSREKCLFSLMGYCSPDRRCTHKHTHTHSLCTTHTKSLPKPLGTILFLHTVSPPPRTPPLSLCFQQPSTDETTAGIKRHRNQGYSYLAVIDFLPPC